MLGTIEKKRMTRRLDAQPLAKRDVPPLENGDSLTQKEFHRRYLAMPDVRAELIEGIVFMSSPAKRHHGKPLSLATGWLFHYEAATDGVETYSDTTLILDDESEVQPDVALVVKPSHGGKGKSTDAYLKNPPGLIVEIANSSVSIDMGKKMAAYRRNNVSEYLVHNVRGSSVHWFSLQNGVYATIPIDRNGVLRSIIFPGLWLNEKALLKRDVPALMRTLNAGLATAEHEVFCARLQDTARKIKKRKTL